MRASNADSNNGHSTSMIHGMLWLTKWMVEDMSTETDEWFASLEPHVPRSYYSDNRMCSLQLPVLKLICSLFGWQDPGIFSERTHGFRLLGPLARGLGWKKRNDRYVNPLDLDDFLYKNKRYMKDKLKQSRVDNCCP